MVAVHWIGRPSRSAGRGDKGDNIVGSQQPVDAVGPGEARGGRLRIEIGLVGQRWGFRGLLEDFLSEELRLGWRCRIERDEVSQRPCLYALRRRCKIGVEAGTEFGKQDCELRRAHRAHVAAELFDLDQFGPGRLQHFKRFGEGSVRRAVIAGLEPRDADALALQGVDVERGGIVLLAGVCFCGCGVRRVRASDDGEKKGGVRDGQHHRPGRVLRRADRHDVRARDEADGWLEADNAVGGGGAHDRTVRLGADGRRSKASRHRRARTGRRPAGIAVKHMRIARLAAHRTPA